MGNVGDGVGTLTSSRAPTFRNGGLANRTYSRKPELPEGFSTGQSVLVQDGNNEWAGVIGGSVKRNNFFRIQVAPAGTNAFQMVDPQFIKPAPQIERVEIWRFFDLGQVITTRNGRKGQILRRLDENGKFVVEIADGLRCRTYEYYTEAQLAALNPQPAESRSEPPTAKVAPEKPFMAIMIQPCRAIVVYQQ